MNPEDLRDLAQRMRAARRVVVLTGAGISAPSGLATYRQAGSGWTDADLEAKSRADRYGNHLDELWQFWGALRSAARDAEPNEAHAALTRAQARCESGGGWLRVVTQNVDGLHTRAGTSGVLELHGSIHRTRCLRRCEQPYDDARLPESGYALRCAHCGRLARPDVVLFGEQLPARVLRAAAEAMDGSDLCVYVGTSGNVWPASDLVLRAERAGALCVLVNAEPWDHPHPSFTHTVLADAADALPDLLG